MFSRQLKGTSKKKTTMNWWEYWIGHCWMTGWQTIGMSFRNWRDLMTGNYEGYALMFYDDPYENVIVLSGVIWVMMMYCLKTFLKV